jgi:hypothetical protein
MLFYIMYTGYTGPSTNQASYIGNTVFLRGNPGVELM